MSAMQCEYNLVQRTAERELIPRASHFGLGMMCYSPLAYGLIGKYREGSSARLRQSSPNRLVEDELTKKIINKLLQIARDYDSTAEQIALAWTMSKCMFLENTHLLIWKLV